jgi:hypothetical protein
MNNSSNGLHIILDEIQHLYVSLRVNENKLVHNSMLVKGLHNKVTTLDWPVTVISPSS